jgi:hypothetical protein
VAEVEAIEEEAVVDVEIKEIKDEEQARSTTKTLRRQETVIVPEYQVTGHVIVKSTLGIDKSEKCNSKLKL